MPVGRRPPGTAVLWLPGVEGRLAEVPGPVASGEGPGYPGATAGPFGAAVTPDRGGFAARRRTRRGGAAGW